MTKILPEADTRPWVLFLQKNHKEYCKFRDAMNTAMANMALARCEHCDNYIYV